MASRPSSHVLAALCVAIRPDAMMLLPLQSPFGRQWTPAWPRPSAATRMPTGPGYNNRLSWTVGIFFFASTGYDECEAGGTQASCSGDQVVPDGRPASAGSANATTRSRMSGNCSGRSSRFCLRLQVA